LDRLESHWEYLRHAWEEAQAAPLSTRKALLVAVLVDDLVERIASRQAGDRLAWLAAWRRQSPQLAVLHELCALRQSGPRLELSTVAVPIEHYPALALEDFMVSLYNGHTVQQVSVIWADSRKEQVHPLLADAVAEVARALSGLSAA
jgi:hypothetical protein